ncbi:MAG: PAS domain-containing protein [Comamonadaceae bacterium]|nr:PAS domain-containing protein [Comamonadaceae bacterium]
MSGEPYAPTLGAAIAALRQKAEAVLDNGVRPDPQGVDDRSPDALRQALHELQVHQIELELQNDELRRMQVELDAERARYFDLYDLAPVGYCTISEHGLILEANFTAANLLGLARSELVGEPLSRFIVRADQDIYYLCRRHLVDTGEPQACELRMMPVGGAPFWAHLRAAAAPDARGSAGVPPGAGRCFGAQEAGAGAAGQERRAGASPPGGRSGQPGQVGLPCRHEP